MKQGGNVALNRIMNPKNVKPAIPLDPDELDTEMEKFIRQKYQYKKLAGDTPVLKTRHNTGSTTSSEDRPPPPPPKPLARFGPGLRSFSSTFPSASPKRPTSPVQPSPLGNNNENPRMNALSGGRIRGRRRSSFDGKLQHLRQIGFKDGERNLEVLKEVDGDIPRAIDLLTWLGGGRPTNNGEATNGAARMPASSTGVPSSNPYQRQDRPALSTVNSVTFEQDQVAPVQNPHNPFNAPLHNTQHPLETSFQDMRLASQTLFPNHTGTWPQESQQPQIQHNPFLKMFTPPISPSSCHYVQPFPVPLDLSSQASIPQSATTTNPFFRPVQPQRTASTNPFEQAQQGQQAPQQLPQHLPNPVAPNWAQSGLSQPPGVFAQVPPVYDQQPQQYIPQAPVASPYTQPYQSPEHFQQASTNSEYPFYQQQPDFLSLQQQQTLSQPSTPFRDKNSILALYSQPQLAPTRHGDSIMQDQSVGGQEASLPTPGNVKRRSVTMPSTSTGASHNPFANLALPQANGSVNQDPSNMRWSGAWQTELSARVGGR